MRRSPACVPEYRHVFTLAASTWFACGAVLFGLTPLPWRDASLGWTPVFWLLAAPAIVLLAMYVPGERRRICATHPKASRGRRERRRITRRPSAASGAYPPVREHRTRGRRAGGRVQRVR